VEKRVAYHLISSPYRSTGDMLPFFRANELSVGWRYTTHHSLGLPLPRPALTHGMGSAKRWRPCTPAMAAGLTDQVWSLREVLLFRVPPWP
jgi:hypothetical protein